MSYVCCDFGYGTGLARTERRLTCEVGRVGWRGLVTGAMNSESMASIRLRLRDLAQLFNSMDPSPFRDRDLDANAEEFIVSWARELPPRKAFELVIHVDNPPTERAVEGVGDAVRHYFSTRAELKMREFRVLLRRGRVSLLIGLLFLAACLAASEIITSAADSTLGRIIGESLTIVGWVAMWRPLEIYLYDWWPLRDERRVLEKLQRMDVRIEVEGGGG